MIDVGRAGGHFEGSIVLMGALLAAHGVVAFVHAMVTRVAILPDGEAR
jgi:hypothetical protein